MTNSISTIKNIANAIFTRIESEEKGSGLVEMALVLGVLLVLTFGIIDISRCIYTNSVVSVAAQEGARAGIVDTNDIRTTIESRMVGLDMSNMNIIVKVDGDVVEVEIAYDFEFVTPLASSFMNELALSGKASMVTM